MSAATFLPPDLTANNLAVDDSLSVTNNVSVGNDATVAGLVSAGNVAASGNAQFGSNGASTFKSHGATAQSGLQSAFVAQLGAFTDPPSAPEMEALRTAVNSLLTCLIDHGFMAAS